MPMQQRYGRVGGGDDGEIDPESLLPRTRGVAGVKKWPVNWARAISLFLVFSFVLLFYSVVKVTGGKILENDLSLLLEAAMSPGVPQNFRVTEIPQVQLVSTASQNDNIKEQLIDDEILSPLQGKITEAQPLSRKTENVGANRFPVSELGNSNITGFAHTFSVSVPFPQVVDDPWKYVHWSMPLLLVSVIFASIFWVLKWLQRVADHRMYDITGVPRMLPVTATPPVPSVSASSTAEDASRTMLEQRSTPHPNVHSVSVSSTAQEASGTMLCQLKGPSAPASASTSEETS